MAMHRLARRDLLRLAAASSAAVVLAGCGQRAGGGARPVVTAAGPAPIQLEWWPGWPGPYMLTIARLFEERNPGVKIKTVSNYPEIQAVLATVAAGTPPDLIADVPYMELIVRGTVHPLDDLIGASSQVSMTDGDIPKELWETFAWEGKHYGIPSVDTAGREGMGFNLNLVEKAGLDPQSLPLTWEEVFDWHKAITTYDSAGNIQTLGMAPMA